MVGIVHLKTNRFEVKLEGIAFKVNEFESICSTRFLFPEDEEMRKRPIVGLDVIRHPRDPNILLLLFCVGLGCVILRIHANEKVPAPIRRFLTNGKVSFVGFKIPEKKDLFPFKELGLRKRKVDVGYLAADLLKDPNLKKCELAKLARKVIGIKEMVGIIEAWSLERHEQIKVAICEVFISCVIARMLLDSKNKKVRSADTHVKAWDVKKPHSPPKTKGESYNGPKNSDVKDEIKAQVERKVPLVNDDLFRLVDPPVKVWDAKKPRSPPKTKGENNNNPRNWDNKDESKAQFDWRVLVVNEDSVGLADPPIKVWDVRKPRSPPKTNGESNNNPRNWDGQDETKAQFDWRIPVANDDSIRLANTPMKVWDVKKPRSPPKTKGESKNNPRNWDDKDETKAQFDWGVPMVNDDLVRLAHHPIKVWNVKKPRSPPKTKGEGINNPRNWDGKDEIKAQVDRRVLVVNNDLVRLADPPIKVWEVKKPHSPQKTKGENNNNPRNWDDKDDTKAQFDWRVPMVNDDLVRLADPPIKVWDVKKPRSPPKTKGESNDNLRNWDDKDETKAQFDWRVPVMKDDVVRLTDSPIKVWDVKKSRSPPKSKGDCNNNPRDWDDKGEIHPKDEIKVQVVNDDSERSALTLSPNKPLKGILKLPSFSNIEGFNTSTPSISPQTSSPLTTPEGENNAFGAKLKRANSKGHNVSFITEGNY